MIVQVEKQHTGRAEWAKGWLGCNIRTPHGVGKVQAANYHAATQTVTLEVWVKDPVEESK